MRIGYGFCPGRAKERSSKYIVLAGREIPWHLGLMKFGECEHDVLSLAAAESLIGAMGMGSLKSCSEFDDKNTPGITLLAQVSCRMAENGFQLGNMDIQLTLQDVRFQAYADDLKKRLCAAMQCEEDRLNLKIDHELWLGYTGSNQGIKATAVCLIEN